jgi:hypothetical protein
MPRWNNAPVVLTGAVFLHPDCDSGVNPEYSPKEEHQVGDLLLRHGLHPKPSFGDKHKGTFQCRVFDGEQWRAVQLVPAFKLANIQYPHLLRRWEKALLVRERLVQWGGRTVVWDEKARYGSAFVVQ